MRSEMVRSFLVTAPLLGLVALSACAVEGEPTDESVGSQSQAICTMQPCPVTDVGTIGPPPPPPVQCDCSTRLPNGNTLWLGQNKKTGQYYCNEVRFCSPQNFWPSTYVSSYNPCRYTAQPYLRCNNLGSCSCSYYP